MKLTSEKYNELQPTELLRIVQLACNIRENILRLENICGGTSNDVYSAYNDLGQLRDQILDWVANGEDVR